MPLHPCPAGGVQIYIQVALHVMFRLQNSLLSDLQPFRFDHSSIDPLYCTCTCAQFHSSDQGAQSAMMMLEMILLLMQVNMIDHD